MFERTQQQPARPTARWPGPAERWPEQPPGVAEAPGGELRAVSASPAPVRTGSRLTARGAGLGVFVLSLLGVLGAGWLGFRPLAGGAFAVAAALAAARTQRSGLLAVVVTCPALFAIAVICARALTATGGQLLSTAEGTLITLSGAAPWLLGGTAACLVIAFSRGLWGNVRALGADLHADPHARAAGTDGAGGPQRR